jgi:pimeloyl-ACP methyl ester carboxylesterase
MVAAPSPDAWNAFLRAYQDQVDRWPVPVTSRLIDTDRGVTHVLESGESDAPCVVLLPGGGATATAWSAVAGQLASARRVLAVDPVGQPAPGSGTPMRWRTPDDVARWLEQVLDTLLVEQVTLVGHSYGAWMALRHAMAFPDRIARLVLVDPTDCFAPLSLSYRLHALPVLVRPNGARLRRLLAWETRARRLDPGWTAVAAAGADLGRSRIVIPRPPTPAELAHLPTPVLLVLAARSRAHDPRRVGRRGQQTLRKASVAVLPEATHHTLPTLDAQALADLITHAET